MVDLKDETNFDEVFLRRLIVGISSFFYDNISIEQSVRGEKTKKPVKIFYSVTGDQNFIVDNFLPTDKYCEEFKVKGNIEYLPSGIFKIQNPTISTDNLKSSHVRAVYVKQIQDEYKTVLAEFSSRVEFLPLDISFSITIKASSENDRFKIYEQLLIKFNKVKKFWIKYKGFVLPVLVQFPNDYGLKDNFQFKFPDDNRRYELEFSISTISFLPVIDESTERLVGEKIKKINSRILNQPKPVVEIYEKQLPDSAFNESDPVFRNSAASQISTDDIDKWNYAYNKIQQFDGGGNGIAQESDPVFNNWLTNVAQVNHWNQAFSWGNHADEGYLITLPSHNHDDRYYTETEVDNLLTNKDDLVGGVIPTSQIPAIAISEFLGVVNTEAAMLALVGQRGDWCVRTDGGNKGTWIGISEPLSLLANWRLIEYPNAPVISVNGQTGVIVLGKSDVGLGNVPNMDATNPINISQNSNYRFVSDSEKSSWNAKMAVAVSAEVRNLAKLGSPDNLIFVGRRISSSHTIDFSELKIFGSVASPLTGSLLVDYSAAVDGMVQIGYHNAASKPPFPVSWIEVSSDFSYVPNVTNYFMVKNIGNNKGRLVWLGQV